MGWTEAETRAWASPLIDDMDAAMLTTETPMFYLARGIVDEKASIDRLTQKDQHDLIRSVENILKEGNCGSEFPIGFDFLRASNAVQRIIGGES